MQLRCLELVSQSLKSHCKNFTITNVAQIGKKSMKIGGGDSFDDLEGKDTHKEDSLLGLLYIWRERRGEEDVEK